MTFNSLFDPTELSTRSFWRNQEISDMMLNRQFDGQYSGHFLFWDKYGRILKKKIITHNLNNILCMNYEECCMFSKTEPFRFLSFHVRIQENRS